MIFFIPMRLPNKCAGQRLSNTIDAFMYIQIFNPAMNEP